MNPDPPRTIVRETTKLDREAGTITVDRRREALVAIDPEQHKAPLSVGQRLTFLASVWEITAVHPQTWDITLRWVGELKRKGKRRRGRR